MNSVFKQIENFHPCKPLRILMRGTFRNADARILSDSGASHNFVSQSFVESPGIKFTPARGVLHCAGSSITASVSGMIDRRMVLKG